MFALQFHGQVIEILNFAVATANKLKLALVVINQKPFLADYFDATNFNYTPIPILSWMPD